MATDLENTNEPSLVPVDIRDLNIHERLFSAQQEAPRLEKRRENAGLKGAKYASIGDTLQLAYPLLHKYGLQFRVSSSGCEVTGGHMVITYIFSVWCSDDPKQITSHTMVAAGPLNPFGGGISESYAAKRGLCQVLGLTDWERDSSQYVDQEARREQRAQQQQAKAEPAAESPKGVDHLLAELGKVKAAGELQNLRKFASSLKASMSPQDIRRVGAAIKTAEARCEQCGT